MLDNLRPALVITRREMRDHFRDWRIIGPILLLVLLLPILMNYTSARFLALVEDYGALIEVDQLFPFLLLILLRGYKSCIYNIYNFAI